MLFLNVLSVAVNECQRWECLTITRHLKSQIGLRKRELSQERRIPFQRGIKQLCVNYFPEYRITQVKNHYLLLRRLV